MPGASVSIEYVLLGMGAVLIVLLVLRRWLMRSHSTGAIIRALYSYFSARREKIVEFRNTKEKATTKVREFEVKTIHRRYYRVSMTGLAVVEAAPIVTFSTEVKDSYIRGTIDPVNLQRYDLSGYGTVENE